MNRMISHVELTVSDELSMLYPTVNNGDDEIEHSDKDYVVSKKEDLQTPVNPVTENAVTQWEGSQWFSNTRHDYTRSGAFLDMGSGSPIDDLVKSGTLRLLDWNDSMIDI
ncbi:hypothetical protein M9H77_17415 [Catharanthus roseus]|uniref:Uncharacterized protein n=1 Tax=Catharanthus roseus TaxID=4058 RepID=A0ACC0B4I7_CATRO|nr:hypothetical protein M9H77_17415 [Catharanthus roseus]